MGPSAGGPTFTVCMRVGTAVVPDSLTCLEEGQKLIFLVQGLGGFSTCHAVCRVLTIPVLP